MEQNNTLKVAIIGGSGKIGSLLVKELVNKGFRLKLILRNPEKVPVKSDLISIIKGDARNYESIESLMQDCPVLINLIGQPKGEPPVFSQVAENIVRASLITGTQRYISVSGLGLTTPNDQKRLYTRLITGIIHTLVPKISKDKRKEFELISQSSLNWTILRIPMFKLRNKPALSDINVLDCIGTMVDGLSLIHFLIDQINDTSYWKKAPFMSSK